MDDDFRPDTGAIGVVDARKNAKLLLESPRDSFRGIAVSRSLNKLYWTQVDVPGIYRSDLDGSNTETVVNTAISFPTAVRVDATNGMLYWGDMGTGRIERIDLIGTPSSRQIVIETPFHNGLAIDEEEGRLYWSTTPEPELGSIWSANLDGSDAQEIITGTAFFKPAGVALDGRGWIYWTDYVQDVVMRARLSDPQNTMETLYEVGQNLNPNGIAVRDNFVYWSQDTSEGDALGSIMRMRRNGNNPRPVRSDTGSVVDLAFGRCP